MARYQKARYQNGPPGCREGFSHTVALVEWRRAPGRERERERDDGMNVSSSSFSESRVNARFGGGGDGGGGTNVGWGA